MQNASPSKRPASPAAREIAAKLLPRQARGGGSPLANVLQSTIGRLDSAAKVRESLALAQWPRVVGPQAAAATEPEVVRDGVLFVRTKSSVWSHELALHKARILLGLNRLLGGKVITDIVFRAQGVTKKEEVEETDTPSSEELATVILEAAEEAELRARLQALSSVPGDHARRTIAARLTAEAKLRHWRLERGWRVCPRCASVHKTEFTLCPICRLCG